MYHFDNPYTFICMTFIYILFILIRENGTVLSCLLGILVMTTQNSFRLKFMKTNFFE